MLVTTKMTILTYISRVFNDSFAATVPIPCTKIKIDRYQIIIFI